MKEMEWETRSRNKKLVGEAQEIRMAQEKSKGDKRHTVVSFMRAFGPEKHHEGKGREVTSKGYSGQDKGCVVLPVSGSQKEPGYPY